MSNNGRLPVPVSPQKARKRKVFWGCLLCQRRASGRLFCDRLLIGDGDDCNDALREARIPLVELVDEVEGKVVSRIVLYIRMAFDTNANLGTTK